MSRAFLDRTARLVSCILNLPVTLIACHLTPSGSRAGHASGVGAAPDASFPVDESPFAVNRLATNPVLRQSHPCWTGWNGRLINPLDKKVQTAAYS